MEKTISESRLLLLQSEITVRNKIQTIKEKIERNLRKAERKLLRDLRVLVKSQIKKIHQLEEMSIPRMSKDHDETFRKTQMREGITLNPAIVLLKMNDNMQHIMSESTMLGTVELFHPEKRQASHGYVEARLVGESRATRYPHSSQYDEVSIERPELGKTDKVIGVNSQGRTSHGYESYNAHTYSNICEKCLLPLTGRQRRNIARKTATMIMQNANNTLGNIEEEQDNEVYPQIQTTIANGDIHCFDETTPKTVYEPHPV